MINEQRIIERIDAIYKCGEKEDGTHSRIAFSKEDVAGRELFAKWLKELGIDCYFDPAGNMIGRLEGTEAGLPPIMIGSHLDTVPDGGKYDGVFGCIGGLEIAEALLEDGITLRHPLEIIVFADEEGIAFGKGLSGSNALSGLPLEGFQKEDVNGEGIKRVDAMKVYGVDFDHMADAARETDEVACFLEMHIEQGMALDKAKKQIGIVSAIAGVSRFMITVHGETNHSGSTLMPDRKDALVGAADFIRQVPLVVREYGSEYAVGTVGRIEAVPGSMNVIPGQVTFSLEIREQSDPSRLLIERNLFECLTDICQNNRLSFSFSKVATYPCAPMNQAIMDIFESICEEGKFPAQIMPSGAFHDAMFMTRSFPTGMLFVPSKGGISHSPMEFTSSEDLKTGCEVLYRSVCEIDRRLNDSF